MGWTGFSTTPIEVDYAPNGGRAGISKVEIVQSSGDGATGVFTMTYAKDVTGRLGSGITRSLDIAYPGQDADFLFTGVAGRRLTLSISNPRLSNHFAIGVFDSSGAPVVGWTGLQHGPLSRSDKNTHRTEAQTGPTTGC